MFAGHLAAGLALKTAAPRAPTPLLLALAFLPDLLWLGLARAGIERVAGGAWFDGWSHSIASILLQAALVWLVARRHGSQVAAALAAAVLSHLLLDLPMHPAPLEFYPHAAHGYGNLLHGWANQPALLGKSRGWWVEAAVVLAGTLTYVAAAARTRIRATAAGASMLFVIALQLAFG